MKPPVPQKEADSLPAVISTPPLPSPPRGAADTARADADFCSFGADRRSSILLLQSSGYENDEGGARCNEDGDADDDDDDDDDGNKRRDLDVGEMENPDAKQEQTRASVRRRAAVRMST